ncbi:MAG: insulinase family protein [Planctomycetes bacterium]|nr:insulinase family protein [Planctomycetota bacterium]
MKHSNIIFILLSILFMAGAIHSQGDKIEVTKAEAKLEVSSAEFIEYKLDNGLEVIIKPMHRIPLVATFMFYKVGSSFEMPEYYGASHFLEHLMFKGTDKYKKGEIDKISQLNGGENNAYTTTDYTAYHFQFPTKNWEIALEIEANRMRNCSFVEKEFYAELEVVLEELNESFDDPWSYMFMQSNPLIYGHKHAYGHPILGNETALRQLTPEKMRQFYDNFYQPDNAVLVIAGDINVADAKEKVEKHLGKIEARKTEINRKFEKFKNAHLAPSTGYHNINKDTNITRMTASFNTVPRKHPDYPALLVLDNILSSGESSRLMKKILTEKKLADDFGSWSYCRALAGEFTFWAELPLVRDFTAIIDEIHASLSELAHNMPTDYEVSKAKNQTLASLVFSGQKTHNIAQNLGFNKIAFSDADYQSKFIEKIQAVTPEDVQRVVKTYFDKDKAVITVMKPREEIKIETFGAKGFEIQKFTLENGLTVEFVEEHNAKMIALDLDIRLGSLFEPANKIGVYNLLGKMLLQGTAKKSALEISEKINFWGAKVESRGDGISASILRKDFAEFMHLLAEIVITPTFPEDRLTIKKKLAVNALKSLLDDPDEISYMNFMSLLYPAKHPYAFHETVEGLNAISREDIQKFYKQHFMPNNATLHVVGDIKAPKLAEILNREFACWQKGKTTELKLPEVKLQTDDRTTYKKFADAVQASIYIGHRGIKRSNPDYYALLVLDNILGTGAGFTDRLSADLRDTQGYAYSVWMVLAEGARYDYGRLIGGIQTSKENIVNSIAGIIKHLELIRNEKVTDEEIKGAKKYLIGSFPSTYESYEELVKILRRINVYGLGYGFFADFPQKIEAVTKDEVLRVAKKYLHPETLTISICGDIDEGVDYLSRARELHKSVKESKSDDK